MYVRVGINNFFPWFYYGDLLSSGAWGPSQNDGPWIQPPVPGGLVGVGLQFSAHFQQCPSFLLQSFLMLLFVAYMMMQFHYSYDFDD